MLKEIYLNNFYIENKAKMLPFAGFSMPINYELGIIKEHLQVRKSSGIFDVSHMGQILIDITDKNIQSLKKYIPLNLDNLKLNKSYYTFIINENGGVIDDIMVSKIFYDNDYFLYIVYNSSRRNEDEKIFKNILDKYNILYDNSLLAIQGPEAKNILSFLNLPDNFYFMESRTIDFKNNSIIVNRSGYTGEDGFEISIPNIIILEFIKLILTNDKTRLCGLGSRDSLRLEAGLSLYGNELNENITPIEANLTWALHKRRLEDPKLNGRKILLKQITSGSHFKKIGLKPISKIILRKDMKLLDINKKCIGYISSGGFSPTLNSSIAIGYIDNSLFVNERLFCFSRGKLEELIISSLPFIKHNYKKGNKNE